jgi:NAD(P)-dependent dehydrogenase (short-subunit alcohol dehydrogenase family)
MCTDIDGTAAEETAAELASPYGHAAHRSYRLDVADRAEVDAVAARVTDELGALGILVNNAGVGMTGPFSRMTAEEWGFIRSINLDGVVNCCSAFAPPMLAAGRGHVVNVSSGLAFVPTAGESAYAATKAAVLQLSLCLRADWAAQGVVVTAICPGFVNTAIARSARFTGGLEDARARARLVKGFSRAHPPEKVGHAIVRAIATDRAVVPVGFESILGWYAHRCMPVAVQQFLARLGRRR